MTKRKIAILGATSGLAQAVVRLLAKQEAAFTLVARDESKLEAIASDLRARGCEVSVLVADLADCSGHEALMSNMLDINEFHIYYGVLPEQEACQQDMSQMMDSLHTNFVSVASLISLIANKLERDKTGTLLTVSSVAGDRGRKANYIYGSSKAALTAFLSGVRGRLHKSGVQVITIKPGFIDTEMTKDIPKNPKVLWATPEKVAVDIVKAIDKKQDVVYTLWFWRYILLIIKLIPESIFKKTSI